MILEHIDPSIAELQQKLSQEQPKIQEWFQTQTHHKVFYASMDVRFSHFKVAACDTNLYPAGWNHMHQDDEQAILNQMQQSLGKHKRILLIPEAHTTNIGYYENLFSLRSYLEKSGYQVTVASTIPYLRDTTSITLPQQRAIDLHPLVKLEITPQHYDAIILNHDRIHQVVPEINDWQIPVIPYAELGWNQRKKSTHFLHYNQVAQAFCETFDIDPFRLMIHTEALDSISLQNPEDRTKLKDKTAQILAQIQNCYQERSINKVPFVAIKANGGTYGNAVMMVSNPEEIDHLSKKQKSAMEKVKGSEFVDSLIIQEGIHSDYTHENHAAEPVLYTCNHAIVGAFIRSHPDKSQVANLNSKGMQFTPISWQNMQSQGVESPLLLPSIAAQIALIACSKEAS